VCGEVISIGVNLANSSNFSFTHAEMFALSLARKRLGPQRFDARSPHSDPSSILNSPSGRGCIRLRSW
jgi:hypothetical protein